MAVHETGNLNVHDKEQRVLTNRKPKGRFDLTYRLMQLKAREIHRMQDVLDPKNHTTDTEDYQLSWIVSVLLKGIDPRMSLENMNLLHVNYASQLEQANCLPEAVAVLQHILDDSIRKHLQKEIVMRHPELYDLHLDGEQHQDDIYLLSLLDVSPELFARSKLTRLSYENYNSRERCFTLACEANMAMKAVSIFREDLLTPLVLSNQFQELRNCISCLYDKFSFMFQGVVGVGQSITLSGIGIVQIIDAVTSLVCDPKQDPIIPTTKKIPPQDLGKLILCLPCLRDIDRFVFV